MKFNRMLTFEEAKTIYTKYLKKYQFFLLFWTKIENLPRKKLIYNDK